jgi:hypothetical protein
MDLTEGAMKKAEDVVNSAQNAILSGGSVDLELLKTNVRFGEGTLTGRLTLDNHEPLLGLSAPKEPFAQSASTKQSVATEKRNMGSVGF